jgi:hypothetical protein
VDPERQRLIAQISKADTPDRIKAAKAATEKWLADHPQDTNVKMLVGLLLIAEAVHRVHSSWK